MHPYAPPSSYALYPGAVIHEKYRLDRLLGRGGMGEVYQATHLQLGSQVAIKFIRGEGFESPEARGRFWREAMIASNLNSDHIARVFDIGTLHDGTPFMVMEFLQGTDVASYLRLRGRLPYPEVISLLLQVCDGVAAAHAAGVVHRDLKPANLFLTRLPTGQMRLKILDFGIAKAQTRAAPLTRYGGDLSAPGHTLTSAAQTLGSGPFMAPEQIESARGVDARADLWSIGVIAYLLLSGRLPFDGNTLEEIFLDAVHRRMPPLASLCPELPPSLVAAVDRCLMPDPEARWRSAPELRAALASTSHEVPLKSIPRWALILGSMAALALGLRTAYGLLSAFGAFGSLAAASLPESSLPRISYPSAKDPHRIDPSVLYEHTKATASAYLESPVFSSIHFTSLRDGFFDRDTSKATFVLVDSKTRRRSLIVVFDSGRALGTRSSLERSVQPLPEPRCLSRQAWQTGARKAPAGKAPDSLALVLSGDGIQADWFLSYDGGPQLILDSQTCALKYSPDDR